MQANKGDSQLVKDVNKRLVLGIIERQHTISRAAIARASGLSPTTVSSLINELVEEGFVKELGRGPSRRGRRPVMYQINHEARFVVGADVGSNVLTVIVTDLKSNVIKETQTGIGEQVGQELVRTLYHAVDECIKDSGVDRSKIIGVGVASPGLVDHTNGIVIRAVNAEWENMPLKGILEHELGLPVYVENMNHAAALGEYMGGLDRGVRRFLYLNVGRGVGAGLIVNGRILQGSGVSAGEIGHMVMDRNGEKCTCGARGCLETLVSARAIERQARRMARQFPDSLIVGLAGGDPERVTLEVVAQAAKQQDTVAVDIFSQAGEWIGLAVAGMINVFNPDVVMLGGRVIRAAGDIILSRVRNVARENSFPVLFDMATFMTPRLGHLSSAMGAVAFVLEEKFRGPFLELGEASMR
ncbi:MAG TPA: ROK family transcriptional regulator [Firmicutes bacterium]|nr:ROK family transcriptional regulator [Bacillota bacterium]